MRLESTSYCAAGLHRPTNQDRVVCFQRNDRGLFMVADGMGGHYDGALASETLRRNFSEWWEDSLIAPADFQTTLGQLDRVLQDCNAHIQAITPEGQLCGSTITLLWLQDGARALIQMGDSRCYQVTPGLLLGPKIVQLSRDDSDPSGKLTQAVGARAQCQYSLETGTLPKRALYALCSDGVYKYCAPAAWKRCMVQAFQGKDLDQAVQDAGESIRDGGAGDNYSIVLVRVS